ncbi:putative protein [Arabidopsis thaliana]|uniref:Enhancer of polycomb-like protein n=3 Tax=Arabidopsis TaxID=3701 RepID=A0A5S9Y1F2_ARATH|nr:Enhancer of polycomb-like transcription factor protein [Arabidopsis thaliana]NP_196087.1 Enhancer of polycomb-like transcription factor protein [Arabidopsis thaliana]KAG7608117.1 Enhancer of polycomb-like N-terminal [Arabidopsis suecica]AED90770.1 Enhancer of polycomb-like transcription factor protein [Arabidopsis thaliana]ANM68785.1 Enhancer of polycomb-like transcription factor protein [Arabidopsis thaliana]CAA0400655.1 unnamed protein product [Arabidopsis thaliana]CAD5330820.1 unnamed p|eukprot:NP_001330507.1 Enhancer of polycomb-like transcription factor protein [Arabidopsis thaliana]
MPSVGMRRTTRVFGVVKAADGARVLRSGRRIWPNVGEPKVRRAHDVVDRDCDSVLKNQNKSKGNKVSSGKSNSQPCSPKQVSSEKEDKVDDFPVTKRRKVRNEGVGDEKTVDKMFGIVYSRKRKRLCEPSSSDRSEEPLRSLKFYRRRRKLSQRVSSVLTLTVDWSCEDCWFLTVFGLAMRYIRREELRLSSLASFFLSQPINQVFADHGVRFLVRSPLSSRGVCKFFGAMSCLPLFSADFAVIPRWFMDMHFTLFVRVLPRSFFFVEKSLYLLNNPIEESDSESELALPEPCTPRNGVVVGLHPSVRASKLTGGNAQYRGNLGSHSFQKRRSSLRRRRARNLSHNAHKLNNGTPVFDISGSRKNRTAAVSSKKLRSSVLSNSSPVSNGISIIPMTKTKEELDSICCSANILMIHSDRCTREEGFSVMLEASSSKEWFLVIKKDGAIRYSHMAQRTMRPFSSNRITHATVWMGGDNWKLEFCDRQDWLGFKDIYKECYERNLLEQSVKVIPIPGVREVCGYAEYIDNFPSFSRPPVSYISVNEDEVSRAMARSIALYDMDSEDEEWLERQNQKMLNEEDDQYLQLQREAFELMIDGFEKYHFHSPADDLLDEKAATIGSISYLGRQEVVEAVHDYWLKKRKQRKAPLLRIFQGHQVKKTQLLSKPVFRKRRSFKRQGSQLHGKAKQTSPWMVAVKAAEPEEEDDILRMEEAKVLADKTMETAIAKRRRAQILAENADLAVYKAMRALRIAEAIKEAESREVDTTVV